MSSNKRFPRADVERLEKIQELARPPLRIRWWVLLLAAILCAAQAVLSLLFETNVEVYLNATQISVTAFAFFFLLSLLINPLLRLIGLAQPLNRGEMMALFAALFVSGGISSYGLAPTSQTPF